MNFTVESWAPEYGVSANEQEMDASEETVDVNVEVLGPNWAPIDPVAADIPSEILFIDGVRRIDARLWIIENETSRPGVCATVAAGTVRCNGSARVDDVLVFRGLYASASSPAANIETVHGNYEFVPCSDDTPEGLYLGIHERMTMLESELAAGDGVDLVVFDGPLRGRSDSRGVGYIKTQHVEYLPAPQHRVISQLVAGQRTPIFLIGSGGFSRWSWYQRLPGPVHHPLASIVRCELPGLGNAESAASRADTIAASLPRFASEPHKDSRAPQNLYPIAGLENQLRHRLGDSALMERALRKASFAAAG